MNRAGGLERGIQSGRVGGGGWERGILAGGRLEQGDRNGRIIMGADLVRIGAGIENEE
jgi:hypothetical protein